jgi:hypothetical protein
LNLIKIENDGVLIKSTDYWQTTHAKQGYFYLSINAGAFRLLIPPCMEDVIPQMQTGKTIVISHGKYQGEKDAFEILFDDHSDSPFSVMVDALQADRKPELIDDKKQFQFLAYSESGIEIDTKCYFRFVKNIPCLKKWGK